MRCKRNALLEINHSHAQRSYVDWKYRELQSFVSSPPRMRSGNGGRIAYRFTTRSLPEFAAFYRLFYADGKKMIPDIAVSPLALAVWFMDDGSRSRTSAYLNTQQFPVSDQLRMIDILERQHGLLATLNKDKEYYRIRIRVGSIERFKALVSDYVLPELRYKIP